LATPIEPLRQNPEGWGEARLETGQVAWHAVVVVIPAELGSEPRQQDPQPQMAGLPTPWGEPLQGGSSLLACGSACDMVLPCPVLVPATLASQQFTAGLRGWGWPAAGHDPRLLGRSLPPDLPPSLASQRVEAFGLGLSLNCTHDIVCIPDQTGLLSTWLRDHPFEPPIHGIVLVDMGKKW